MSILAVLLLSGMLISDLPKRQGTSMPISSRALIDAEDKEIFAEAQRWEKQRGVVVTEDFLYNWYRFKQGNTLGTPWGIADFVAALQEMPVIHIVVIPAPPRDYEVRINGKSYLATERSEYGVNPIFSLVEVEVTRKDKPPCRWKGIPERKQKISCNL
ncbi:hypothetical protein AB7008_30215 [Bradyrhizobium sp. 521_C7_N1_3]|uniref:hypothetical protein n=1 Tax=Bradyrhizobium sp. 521_C7_N1_3 TaxID=3240368 RepID=UPI003F88B775